VEVLLVRTRIAAVLSLALVIATAASGQPQPGAAAPGAEPSSGVQPRSEGAPYRHFERFVPHPSRLGVQLQDMTPELREFMHAPREHGVLVVRVNQGSPAEKAGLRVGDVITSVEGAAVDETPDLVHAVLSAEKDAKLSLEIVRDGKARTLEAALEGEPAFAADPMGWVEERMPEFRESIEQRMRELEARMKELEERLKKASPSSGELDT
jgi:membrane-associated protease RseP (regulator of RpoE activity)